MGRIQGQFSWRKTHACTKVGLKAGRFKGQCKIRHQLQNNIKLQEVLNWLQAMNKFQPWVMPVNTHASEASLSFLYFQFLDALLRKYAILHVRCPFMMCIYTKAGVFPSKSSKPPFAANTILRHMSKVPRTWLWLIFNAFSGIPKLRLHLT